MQPFAGSRARILLADDNITNQQVGLGILKKLGLHADAVGSGVEVLQALKMVPYDLVLMDVQMPEMDGLAATRQIRWSEANGINPKIPIVAMTAHAMQGDRARFLEAGMNDYVSKPVSAQALAEVLTRWLPLTGQPSGAAIGTPAVAAAARVFNRANLLDRLMGHEDLIPTLMDVFLKDMPQQIAALRDYIEAGDTAAAATKAHTIKGAAGNISGRLMADVAFELEKAGKAGNLSAVEAGLPELEQEFERLKTAILEESTGEVGVS